VVRPAPMFGFEDRLLHRSLNATNLLSCNNMQERFWPVHCIDLGGALEQIRMDDTTVGQTYELHGRKEYNMMELKEMVDREILKTRRQSTCRSYHGAHDRKFEQGLVVACWEPGRGRARVSRSSH